MRLVSVLIVAILALFSFGNVALAGGGPGSICDAASILTQHSPIYDPMCDNGKVALIDYDKSGGLYVARVANTAKTGLTPRYNSLTVSRDTVDGTSRQVWEMSFSFSFVSMISVPGYLFTIVDFGVGQEGFLIWNTIDPAHPIPLTGMTYQSNVIGASYNEVAAYVVDFDGEIYKIYVAMNRSNKSGHLRGELFEYRLGPGGYLASGRNWQSSYQLADFAPTYGGNLEVAMFDPLHKGAFHVAYLATDNFDRFELIGVH